MPTKPKLRAHRTDQSLIRAAKHVEYEIAMLVHTSTMLGSEYGSPPTELTRPDWNMALESFLIHFRNLRSFLCPSLQVLGNDDVIASDFLGEQMPKDIGDSARLGVDKQRLDRMLSHLSYSRDEYITSGKSAWRIADLTVIALDEFEKFLARLPEEKVPWFPSRETIREHRARVPGSGAIE